METSSHASHRRKWQQGPVRVSTSLLVRYPGINQAKICTVRVLGTNAMVDFITQKDKNQPMIHLRCRCRDNLELAQLGNIPRNRQIDPAWQIRATLLTATATRRTQCPSATSWLFLFARTFRQEVILKLRKNAKKHKKHFRYAGSVFFFRILNELRIDLSTKFEIYSISGFTKKFNCRYLIQKVSRTIWLSVVNET